MIQKAVSNTIELEPYLVKYASSKVMQVTQEDPEKQDAVTVIQSTCTERSCGYNAKAGEESRTVIEMTSQKNPVPKVQPSKQPLRSNQANQVGPVV